jgi:hypothetical protein
LNAFSGASAIIDPPPPAPICFAPQAPARFAASTIASILGVDAPIFLPSSWCWSINFAICLKSFAWIALHPAITFRWLIEGTHKRAVLFLEKFHGLVKNHFRLARFLRIPNHKWNIRHRDPRDLRPIARFYSSQITKCNVALIHATTHNSEIVTLDLIGQFRDLSDAQFEAEKLIETTKKTVGARGRLGEPCTDWEILISGD